MLSGAGQIGWDLEMAGIGGTVGRIEEWIRECILPKEEEPVSA